MQKTGVPTGPLRLSLHGSGLLPSMPWLRQRVVGVQNLFILGVIVPTLLATVYYGLFASKRYVSEAQFVVRGINHRKTTGLEMLFQTFGLSRAVDDANVIQSYLLSHDAMRAINVKLPLREYFGRSRADILSRFPRPWRADTDEHLYEYYLDRVSVLQSTTKGISTLSVQAFDPGESQAIAEQALLLAEAMVNRMNVRAQNDAVRYAIAELETAKARLVEAQEALTKFRTQELLIDPSSSSMVVLDTITALSNDLAHANAEVQEATASTAASPALPALVGKVSALKDRIARERAKIAGDGTALAPRVAAYEGLALSRELAEKSVTRANIALDTAQQEAQRQQIYIERIVSPQRPDEDTEPQRLRMILTVLVFSFALTSVVWLLAAGASEHAIE